MRPSAGSIVQLNEATGRFQQISYARGLSFRVAPRHF
jgi:hypothetical protein